MVSPIVAQVAYISLFGATTAACLGSLTRLHQIDDTDTRRGLGALLGLSALWALAQIGHLLAPERWMAVASYAVGLAVGLATVGAWLYFCSAYAGRSYHEKPLYRRLAVATYVPIVLFKLTNPWHGQYFGTTTVDAPFQHVAIQESPSFWVIAGLAYVLSAIGLYMLVDVFEQTRLRSQVARGVVGLAALPVLFDVVGYLSPSPVLGLNYEPVGVGLFAIGALYVVREPFFAVSRYGRTQLIDRVDDAILILDADDRVRDYNEAALSLFPTLDRSGIAHVGEISYEIEADVLADGGTVELARDGETRYFIVRTTPITVGATEIGRSVVCTDITEIERQRRELRRKDEQLEGFATAITHELRNSVGIISGQTELLSQIVDEANESAVRPRVEKISGEVRNMEGTVEQLQTLARYSQTISETEPVDLEAAVRTAERQAGIDELVVDVEDACRIDADEERLQELFKQAFEFAAQNGASKLVVRGHDDGFRIRQDGRSLATFDEEAVFAYGNAVPDPDSAMRLPNLQMLATSHGWEIELVDAAPDETSIAITGARTSPEGESVAID